MGSAGVAAALAQRTDATNATLLSGRIGKVAGAASLVTTTRLKWTVFGRLFPTTRSIMWSRPMVALTSALRDRWVRTRAFYSALFCRQRADGRTDFRRKAAPEGKATAAPCTNGRAETGLRLSAFERTSMGAGP